MTATGVAAVAVAVVAAAAARAARAVGTPGSTTRCPVWNTHPSTSGTPMAHHVKRWCTSHPTVDGLALSIPLFGSPTCILPTLSQQPGQVVGAQVPLSYWRCPQIPRYPDTQIPRYPDTQTVQPELNNMKSPVGRGEHLGYADCGIVSPGLSPGCNSQQLQAGYP